MDNSHHNNESKSVHIMILGGGTAGWMAANIFVKKWSAKQVKITLIESPDVGIVGVGEGSTPTLKRFFNIIDVKEKEWMPHCNATYKVNIRFDGWSPQSGIASYSHPFTSQVDIFTSPALIKNCHSRRAGLDVHTMPTDFLLNGVLAKQNKIPLAPENFPFIMEYGYHFDSSLLGKYLADLGKSRGVQHKIEHIVDAELKGNGDISSLVNKNGERLEADFFIDCSGFSAILIQKKLKVPFQSFKENLFNDAAIVMQTPMSDFIPVETVSTALSAGWCWKIPLTNRYGQGYVYSSDFITADEAETEFRNHLKCIESEQHCRHLKMKVGQLAEHWSHNCLALGLSQGFIEPLEATALHLVQISLELFISTIEKGSFNNTFQQEFNKKIKYRFERVRDYIVAHYKVNTRDDSDYWRENRNNPHLSESLTDILDVWYQRKDLVEEIDRQGLNTHFDAVSWHCLLAGYGVFPPLNSQAITNNDCYIEQRVENFLHGCSLNFGTINKSYKNNDI